MQTDLFPSQVKRPKQSDPAILEKAAREFAETMHKQWPEYSIEEWAEALETNYSACKDGYEFARDLERDGFAPDTEMVNELDSFGLKVSEVCRHAEKQWVRLDGFTPEFAIGDKVDMGKTHRGERYGFVSGIREESAEYEVKTDMNSSTAFIIKAENLKKFKEVEDVGIPD